MYEILFKKRPNQCSYVKHVDQHLYFVSIDMNAKPKLRDISTYYKAHVVGKRTASQRNRCEPGRYRACSKTGAHRPAR